MQAAADRARQTGPVETTPSGRPLPERWKPTIAAVNGYAFGGGFERALMCDIRICSGNASFALPEVKLGGVPPSGALTLPRTIGLGPAMWWLLSGEPMSAEDAYRLGVVTKVVPFAELMPEATKMAETICENGPLAVKAVKQIARLGNGVSLDEARRMTLPLSDRVWSSEDAREGASAFAEKRKPVYKMR